MYHQECIFALWYHRNRVLTMNQSFSQLLESAVLAALQGGRKIMEVYHQADRGIQYKEDNSPVTVADIRSQEAIGNILAKTGIPMMGEEGDISSYAVRRHWNRVWVVDPLDGTKEFVKRNGEFAVNIALVENGIATLGVIFAPSRGMLYYGFGTTAFRHSFADWQCYDDEAFLKNSLKERLPLIKNVQMTAVASISHHKPETASFINRLIDRFGSVKVESVGSSLKFCLVAEGRAHVYPRFGRIMEWDTAAGQVIVEASGGSMFRLPQMDKMTYNREDVRNPYFIAFGADVDVRGMTGCL